MIKGFRKAFIFGILEEGSLQGGVLCYYSISYMMGWFLCLFYGMEDSFTGFKIRTLYIRKRRNKSSQ
jgi:hypothetical protein